MNSKCPWGWKWCTIELGEYLRQILEEQILSEEEREYHEEINRKIDRIEEREHRSVSFQEELKIRGAVTINEFESLLRDKILEASINKNTPCVIEIYLNSIWIESRSLHPGVAEIPTLADVLGLLPFSSRNIL